MKRRGFLGFLAGGAVAGPGMVKQAAAATMAELSVSNLSGGSLAAEYYGGPIVAVGQSGWAVEQLKKLIGRTAEQHAYHKMRMHVVKLDPDLASYRSMALHQKIAMQRDRDYERELSRERGHLEAMIAGWFE